MKANAYALLGILQSHAPNGPAQQLCTDLARKAEQGGASDREVEATLASALVDGLKHGNWPWVDHITPQARRQLAVMSLLDITLVQWLEWLDRDTDAEVQLGIEVGDLVAQMIHALQNVDEPGQDKLYIQAIASLSDEGLFKVVERVTGKAPA